MSSELCDNVVVGGPSQSKMRTSHQLEGQRKIWFEAPHLLPAIDTNVRKGSEKEEGKGIRGPAANGDNGIPVSSQRAQKQIGDTLTRTHQK